MSTYIVEAASAAARPQRKVGVASKHPRAEVWGPRILAGIVFALAFALALDDYLAVRGGLESEAWPSTSGVTEVRRGGQGRSRFGYQYEVDGVPYEGYRAGYMMGPMYRPQLEYDDDAEVIVRYDPADPSRAVLTAGVSWWGLAWSLLAPLALLAAGVYILRVASRS